jgi:hypothetical protein
MGDQVRTLIDGDSLPVEPVGYLATNGWYPGTWVKYTNDPLTFSGAQATVDISDGTGVCAGFLKTGPQHNQPVMLLSDMWRDDIRRPGGDTYKDWTAFDAGAALTFDADNQLQREGSRIVTMIIPGTGTWKIYVFETLDLAERTNPGTGAPLVYLPNQPLYVSNRGYFTNEKEGLTNGWVEHIVVRTGSDREGDFLIISEGNGYAP